MQLWLTILLLELLLIELVKALTLRSLEWESLRNSGRTTKIDITTSSRRYGRRESRYLG